jgi:hypothetical protein
MNDSIRIRLSWGLIAVAVIHAVLLAVLCILMRPAPQQATPDEWPPPPGVYDRPAIGSSSPEKFSEPPAVNYSAQSELKQQCPPGVTCKKNPFNLAPGERLLAVGPLRAVTPAKPQATPIITPASVPTIPAQAAGERTPAKAVQVLLFLNSTQQSREIRQWFDTDANLISLKGRAEFQVYSVDNPLYRARFGQIVPPDQFPVVLIQDASGGHIHAAGKSMIPASAAELVSDIRKSYELYKQAKSGSLAMTGAIKTTGYSWDDAINPEMRLNDNCGPDGCPPEQSWRPGQRVFDRLFDGDAPKNPIEAFLWASAIDIATMAVFGLAFVLLIFILARRGMQ